ncbi:MAG TPA: nucleotidyltransferase family protein [Puia sp.]|nr:nucleotidyltransferase family protein [Puia sp.]
MEGIGVIILAAGSSSRYRDIKQLAFYGDKTFIRHAVDVARAAVKKVIVVLGANMEKIKKEIEDMGVTLVFNKDWQEGMASSIRAGLSTFLEMEPEAAAVIFMVCDQPFVSPSLLDQLITKHTESNKEIIASTYQHTAGIPALFGKTFFPALLRVTGQSGAKKIIRQHGDAWTGVPFPLGYIDIDTPEDFERLQKKPFNT